MSLVALGTDPDDGGPVWAPPRGAPLVPGQLAWAELTTGHHCQTWLCWSVELWVPTLVKVARPGWSRPRWTRALGREARALRPLRHPAFPGCSPTAPATTCRTWSSSTWTARPWTRRWTPTARSPAGTPRGSGSACWRRPEPARHRDRAPGHLPGQRPARRPPGPADRPRRRAPAGQGAAPRRGGRHRRLRRSRAGHRGRRPGDRPRWTSTASAPPCRPCSTPRPTTARCATSSAPSPTPTRPPGRPSTRGCTC